MGCGGVDADGGGGANIGEGAWSLGEGEWSLGDAGWPLGGVGDGGFCIRGLGDGMAMTGRGPVALAGGLLIMTGGDGGRGLKLEADQIEDLCAAGGIGTGAGGECGVGEDARVGCLRGTVA